MSYQAARRPFSAAGFWTLGFTSRELSAPNPVQCPVLDIFFEPCTDMQVVTPLDPRVHFTLVCGAKSCPPIRIYTPASLEPGLEAASQAFCSGATWL